MEHLVPLCIDICCNHYVSGCYVIVSLEVVIHRASDAEGALQPLLSNGIPRWP